MGVWIETGRNNRPKPDAVVTPCVGVWIETIIRVAMVEHV